MRKMTELKTRSLKPAEVQADWWVVSAAGRPLGRLAARVAAVLRGKHKPCFTPSVDCGDFVIITDAEKIILTGRKMRQKMYYRHSGYPGHLKQEEARLLLARNPERMVEIAVKGMLPHGPLGRRIFRKLKVVRGSAHNFQAQKPKVLEI
jgi:large subunit ribosomal protein L13